MSTNQPYLIPRDAQGFSLIEIMVAITILGIGVLTLAGLFPLAMQRVHVGDLESRATFHAQAKLEELKTFSWDELRATAASDTVDAVFRRDWQVEEDTPVMGMKQVHVLVAWSDSKGPRSVALSSFLSDSGM